MKWTRRRIYTIFLVGIVLGMVAMPVLAAVFTTPTTGTVPLETNSGATINVQGSTNQSLSDQFPDDQTVNVVTEDGNATFSSPGNVNATVQPSDLEGDFTTVTNLDVTNTYLEINPPDKQQVRVSGDTDRFEFTDMQPDDGETDFIYAGTSGTTTVTVYDLDADQDYRAIDQNGDVLDVATSNGQGVVTFDSMPNSEHTVTIQSGSSTPVLSDPQPNGNVSSAPSEFSLYVEDDDFDGDTVTLEWYLNGNQFDTTTANSEGRQSTSSVPTLDSGVNDWSVVATDSTGNVAILNATVGIPGNVFIRNETDGNELITSPVEVTVRFDNGTVVDTRTTTNGEIDMTGLPTEDFIVEVNASQDYHARTVYFQNIIGNRSVYLLNRSYNTIETRFTLNDPTGEYPSSSILYITRPVNQSGEESYRVIHSDRFGVEGVTATLEEDTRYQIAVRNPDGDYQELGPYRSDASETVTVEPGTPEIQIEGYEEGWGTNAELDNRTLEIRYSDPDMQTSRVQLYIHEKGNPDNRLRPNSTYFNLGNFSTTYTLTENESEKTWRVNYIVTRDQETFTTFEEVGNNPGLTLPSLSDEWRMMGGIMMMFFFAGAFSVLSRVVGAISIGVVGGLLWWAGWLSGATTGAAIVLYLLIAIVYAIYSSGGP